MFTPMLLALGRPYGDNDSWAPGVRFDYSNFGRILTICFEEPTEHEISAISREDAEFGLFLEDDLMVLLFRFGTLDWMDTSFSIHDIQPDRRPTEDLLGNGTSHFLMTIALLDTKAIVRGLHATTWSPQFGQTFVTGMARQLALPKNKADYERRITALYDRYSPRDLLERCTIRTIGGA